MNLLPPRQTNGGRMVLYAFDVDQTLWLSGGPIKLADLMGLRNSGHLLGLCGNFAAVTLRMPEWHYLFSFIGPGGGGGTGTPMLTPTLTLPA